MLTAHVVLIALGFAALFALGCGLICWAANRGFPLTSRTDEGQ